MYDSAVATTCIVTAGATIRRFLFQMTRRER
jgi:hypothetical protein